MSNSRKRRLRAKSHPGRYRKQTSRTWARSTCSPYSPRLSLIAHRANRHRQIGPHRIYSPAAPVRVRHQALEIWDTPIRHHERDATLEIAALPWSKPAPSPPSNVAATAAIPRSGDREEGQRKRLIPGSSWRAGGLAPRSPLSGAAGIGAIGIIDDDIVDESNLQRQVRTTPTGFAMPKANRPKWQPKPSIRM